MSRKYEQDNYDANPLGGCDIVIDVLKKRNIIDFLDERLGPRSARAEYTYGEAIVTWLIAKLRGAKRAENIYDSQPDLYRHPKFGKGMSPDTFLYILKELKANKIGVPRQTKKKHSKTSKRKEYDDHEICSVDKMNDILIDLLLHIGLLEKGVPYILDYDTTEIETKINDSRKYYNGGGKKAYCPAVAMINNFPVFIENRNGNTNASFNLTETIDKVVQKLKLKGIVIEVIRVDSAAFSEEFISYVNTHELKFVTRAKSPTVQKQKDFVMNWTEIVIKNNVLDVGDTTRFIGKEETRLVIKKVTESEEAGKVTYWGLATNDFDRTSEEIIQLYAQRGDAENLFSSLFEFGWEIMPMRKFEHNTVFLYVSAISYIFYKYITKLFAPVCRRVRENMELKTFRDKFLTVTTWWIDGVLKFSRTVARDYLGLFAFT